MPGLDFGSSPVLPGAVAFGSEQRVPINGHDVDAAVSGVGLAQSGGWERFKVLSSRSVSAARVCGEVLRDKSGGEEQDGRAEGGSEARTEPRKQYHVRSSRLGCCVVRAVL